MRDSQRYVIMGTDEGYGDVMTAEEKAAEMREEFEDCALSQSSVKSEKTSTTGLRCGAASCFCPSFCPGHEVVRSCDSCGHGWLSHALPQQPQQSDVEHAAALALFGCQALPIRLKILLDRLFSTVSRRQLAQLLLQFGWTLDDYARGYIVRDAGGERLDSWQMCSAEEESALLRVCARFAETHPLALRLLAASDGPQPHQGLAGGHLGLGLALGLGLGAPHHTAHALPPSPARTSPPASPPHAAAGKARLPPLEVQQPSPSPLLAASPSPSTSASAWPGAVARGASTPAVLASPGASLSDGGSSEECNGAYETALDLSRDGCSPRPKSGSGKTGKAAGWNSRSGCGSAIELPSGGAQGKPALGKKRVQCNVCLKTFCDKGALKIHFSAVHLREMHKCTVEGCNMMFSSRRSRNRHSANPNPKLHQLQFRRADLAARYPSRSPTDAPPAGLGAGVVGSGTPEDTLTRVLSLRLLQGARPELRFEDSTQAAQAHTSSEDSSMSPKNNGTAYEGESEDADTKAGGGGVDCDADGDGKPEPSWLKRLQKRWQEESGRARESVAAEDAPAAETPAAAEPPQRGTRKRKSQHPTRCAAVAVAGERPSKFFASDSLSSEEDCRI